jgi:hypothetical protein
MYMEFCEYPKGQDLSAQLTMEQRLVRRRRYDILSSSISKWKELPWKSELRLGVHEARLLQAVISWELSAGVRLVMLSGLHMFLIQLKL